MTDPTEKGHDRPTGPTREDRTRLAEAYQARALRRPDLLAANLGVLAGDLLLLAHAVGDRARASAAGAAAPGGGPRLAPTAELFLRLVRQIDRLAHLEHQMTLARPAGGDPAAGEKVAE